MTLGALLAIVASGCAREPIALPANTFDPDTVPDAFATASAAHAEAGTTRGFRLEPSGDLWNGSWRVRLTPSCADSVAAAPKRYAAEDRWLPVIHWRRENGPVLWEFESAGETLPSPAESVLVLSIEVRARNRSAITVNARLVAGFEPGEPGEAFIAADADSFAGTMPGWAADADVALGWVDGGHGAALDRTLRLAPGGTGSVRLVLPAYPLPGSAIAELAKRPHAAVAASARGRAAAARARGTRFSLADPEVERAVAAAERVLLASRVHRAGEWLPTGGPFQYRDVWLRDGAAQIAALAQLGHTQEARALARGLFVYQWPDGPFVSQRGQLDGTGQALWAFEQAFLRPAPDTSCARAAAAAARVAAWLARSHELGSASGWPLATLLPFGDPRDNERVRAQLLGNDAWMLRGLQSGERLSMAAGGGEPLAAISRARERLTRDFFEALERGRYADVPASWQGIGEDWGNLAALWPCRVVPAVDPRSLRLVRRIWARSGGAGLVSYASPDTLHGYLGAGLGHWALLAGRPGSADSVLAALLHWRDATGAGAELFSRRGDFGRNLPPHPTSAAALVLLVRHMLIDDDDDALELTLSARSAWWRGARVSRAPTRWGVVDLAFERTGERVRWRWTPVRVPTVLHLPPGTRLAAAPAAPLEEVLDGRAVFAPAGAHEVSVRVEEVRR